MMASNTLTYFEKILALLRDISDRIDVIEGESVANRGRIIDLEVWQEEVEDREDAKNDD
jgi:hypothetical protein